MSIMKRLFGKRASTERAPVVALKLNDVERELFCDLRVRGEFAQSAAKQVPQAGVGSMPSAHTAVIRDLRLGTVVGYDRCRILSVSTWGPR